MKKLSLALLLMLPFVCAMAQLPVPQLPKVYIDTTYNPPTGTTWHAHTSADFTNALNSANPGDTIVLDAGVVYSGNFVLPVKSNSTNAWIYIVSSAYANLPPPGTRVNPATDEVNMPQLVTPNTTAAITIPSLANHYRLVGLEIYSASTYGCNLTAIPPVNCYSYQLIDAHSYKGNGLVDAITVDRCYIHGSPTQDVMHGILANGSNFAVIDSYISDIHQARYDSQAILAFWTPGPIKVVDNFLSATTEDVMFGGGGGVSNPYVPSDIEFRNNHLYKPESWAQVGITIPPKNQWVVKNNLEFKSGQRVLADSNILEGSWVSGQGGESVLFTVRTSESGNVAVVDDITFTNNIITNVVTGYWTGEHDNNCATTKGCTNPGEVRRIKVFNNLVLFRSPQAEGGSGNFGLMVGNDLKDFILQHTTFVPAAGSNCLYSVFFNSNGYPPKTTASYNIWILDNALCRQPTGNGGGQGITGLTYYMGQPSPLAPRFLGNVMYVPPPDTVQQFPPENYATTTSFVYVDPTNGNYQLFSPDWTQTSDGQEAGINNANLPSH